MWDNDLGVIARLWSTLHQVLLTRLEDGREISTVIPRDLRKIAIKNIAEGMDVSERIREVQDKLDKLEQLAEERAEREAQLSDPELYNPVKIKDLFKDLPKDPNGEN